MYQAVRHRSQSVSGIRSLQREHEPPSRTFCASILSSNRRTLRILYEVLPHKPLLAKSNDFERVWYYVATGLFRLSPCIVLLILLALAPRNQGSHLGVHNRPAIVPIRPIKSVSFVVARRKFANHYISLDSYSNGSRECQETWKISTFDCIRCRAQTRLVSNLRFLVVANNLGPVPPKDLQLTDHVFLTCPDYTTTDL